MQYMLPISFILVGSVLGLFSILLFLETKKGMDHKDRRSNLAGSVFLMAVAIVFLIGGTWVLRSENITKNAIANNEQQLQQQVDTQEISQVNPITTAQEQPQQTQEQLQSQKNVKKQEAEKAVKSFDQIQKNFNTILIAYQVEVAKVNNGTINGYHELEKLSQQTLELFKGTQDIEVAKQYNNEKDIMITAILYLQGSIDDLISCIDDKKLNKFKESQDFMDRAIETNKLVSIGVSKQSFIDGYDLPKGKQP